MRNFRSLELHDGHFLRSPRDDAPHNADICPHVINRRYFLVPRPHLPPEEHNFRFNFWLDVDSAPARVSLSITTLLTISTQANTVKISLPEVSYMKAIDVWMGSCMVHLSRLVDNQRNLGFRVWCDDRVHHLSLRQKPGTVENGRTAVADCGHGPVDAVRSGTGCRRPGRMATL